MRAFVESLYTRNSYNRSYNNDRPYNDENFISYSEVPDRRDRGSTRPRSFRPRYPDFDGSRPGGYKTVETDSNKCFKVCGENLEHRTFWRASESELLGKVYITYITYISLIIAKNQRTLDSTQTGIQKIPKPNQVVKTKTNYCGT